ncbi:MAG TPA: discoidin domain-containing protein [Candidatus Limnocylindrales bacterium]|nr:discoidin domain-containing protein [Candidatus Limnocylindrales bacterium]
MAPSLHGRRARALLALSALLLTGVAVIGINAVPRAQAAGPLISQGKPVTASSTENAGTPASAAVDGNAGTRWSSAFADPQWIRVDLGATATIDQVILNWEAAFARSFQIQTSPDGNAWTTIFSTTTGTGGVQTLAVTGTGRYVRMNGTVRATPYGYSLWEFQVFGTIGGGGTCGTANAAQGRPALASSTENAGTPASAAFDGNTGTRWSSAFADPQWIRVDLGSSLTVCQVVLNWEAAFARSFQIQTSPDGNAWTTIFSTTTGAGGIQTLTVNGTGRYVRMNGTVRATPYGYSLWEFIVRTTGGGNPSPTPSPTPSPDPGGFWGDTTNIPPAQNVLTVKVLNRTNGRYPDSQVFWSFNGQVHSIAEQQYLDMPANSAGRMYFYLGAPNSQYFDFIEFTVGPTVFNGNTTRVDAFGLKLAMRLHAHDGFDVQVGEDQATFAEDRSVTFQKFIDSVPAEFKPLGTVSAPFRIPAPGSYAGFRAGGANANYMSSYAASVGFSASTQDIFGCAGPLAANPNMCAALNRHVAHLPQSQWGTPSLYYQAAPANYYSKFWHDVAISKLSYGFPYDDVANQSSFVSHGNPQWLIVAVGW